MSEIPYLDEDTRISFPEVSLADERGVLCWGGNLSPGMLLSAYEQGVFPWYNPDEPILWWSPDPRFVLFPENLHVSRSMRKLLKKSAFAVTYDQDFRAVMEACRDTPRQGELGSWIGPQMLEGYLSIHNLGYAHSVEVWQDGLLVGGLYGVAIGKIFFGESMFSRVSNASKYGFITLVQDLMKENFALIDSQVHTNHLTSLGAADIPRQDYLKILSKARREVGIYGNWGQLLGRKLDSDSP
jgi:leucyl/phenylalanyl-tRNA--protein transferase